MKRLNKFHSKYTRKSEKLSSSVHYFSEIKINENNCARVMEVSIFFSFIVIFILYLKIITINAHIDYTFDLFILVSGLFVLYDALVK